MPWKKSVAVDERLRFVRDASSDRCTMSELCARYGPHKLADAMAELLGGAREAHPFWGARKLLTVLARRHPRIHDWPAPSTVADLLARRGLVERRRGRHRSTPIQREPIHPACRRSSIRRNVKSGASV